MVSSGHTYRPIDRIGCWLLLTAVDGRRAVLALAIDTTRRAGKTRPQIGIKSILVRFDLHGRSPGRGVAIRSARPRGFSATRIPDYRFHTWLDLWSHIRAIEVDLATGADSLADGAGLEVPSRRAVYSARQTVIPWSSRITSTIDFTLIS